MALGEHVDVLIPSAKAQNIVQECILAIKGGQRENPEIFDLLYGEAKALIDRGVDAIVLGTFQIDGWLSG